MSSVIIDYGMSNLGSIRRALEECGSDVYVSSDPNDLKTASHIILPGVGSFADGIKNLIEKGWVESIKKECIDNNVPLLGICLGMQLLADYGTENGLSEGLGLIQGKVEKLKPTKDTERVPHVGWNEINIIKQSSLLENISEGSDFYFVHSYFFNAQNEADIIAKTPYCGNFASIVNFKNIYGVQFHPEKSTPTGFKLLKNFLEL